MKKKIIIFLLAISIQSHAQQYAWQNVGSGVGVDINNSCLTLLNDTNANVLYAGGLFKNVESFLCEGIAYWNGTVWGSNAPYPNGTTATPHIYSLVKFNGQIYGSGGTTSGYIFHIVDSTLVSDGIANGLVYCFCVYHNKLYAGGEFTSIDGVTAKRIARFNGTSWSPVGGGLTWTQACCAEVRSMCVWNDKLYVGGTFDKAGNIDSANSIAVWNDTTWSRLGDGVLNYGSGLPTAYVYALAVYKNELYVGGELNDASGLTVSGICKWNDTAWSDVGGGFDVPPHVYCMLNKDSSLYVGGLFGGAAGVSGTGDLARWDGNLFHSVGGGLSSGSIKCMAEYNNELYVGGNFSMVGGVDARNIAKYGIYNLVKEIEKEIDIKIYPNPATEEITISSNASAINTIIISDMLGREIYQSKNNLNSKIINLKSFSPGLYFIRVQLQDGSVAVKRFVKSE